MRLNRLALLVIIFFLVLFNRVIAQCFPVDGNIDIYDLENQPNNVLTLTGTTDGAANTFAIPSGELSGLQFPSSDIIYEMVIEEGDTFNLFFDLCPGTNFDASIGIIHKEGISDCANATDDDIVGIEDVSLYNEWSDANGLCPQADFTDNPGFVPIARDVQLDPGTYYIVVDGFSDGLVGDFTLVIGEMLTFDDYSLQQQNQYVDIVFTAPVYGVFDDANWVLGWPMNNANPPNASDYFEFKIQDTEQIIQTGPVLQANGQNLPGPQVPPYPGYDVLRFPLINPPPDGSIIEVTPVYYSFNDNGFAPHPVNLSGIPFEQTMMEIELNELSAPEIDSIYNLSEDNSSLAVKFSEGVYNSNNQGVSIAQFSIETNPTNLSPTISYITNGTTAPLPGDSILIFHLSMLPSSGSESIRIRANENFVFSSSGIAMGPQWSNSILLNDELPPDIISYDFDPDSIAAGVIPDANIKLVFDNSVDLKGETSINSTTFDNIISLNYENDGTLGDAIGFNATINSGRDTITVDPDTSLIQVRRVLLKVAGDTIVDANTNVMAEKQSRFNVADIVIPEIVSSSLAENNEFVFIKFSEPLWSETEQSGDIVPSDFVIELNSEDENSNAAIATINIVTEGNGSTAELRNIDSVRLYLGFGSTNPSGVESITITPASNAIFDQGNNALPDNSSLLFDLSDQLPPSIIIKSNSSSDETGFIHPDANFVITSTEPLQRSDSDNAVITNDNIVDYITLKYASDSQEINYTAVVNEAKTSIEIIPASFIDSTCQVLSGSATVTHQANNGIVAGIRVSGTGVPPGATIKSITNDSSFVLSVNATEDGSDISLTFGTLIEWRQVSLTIEGENDGLSIIDEAGNAIETKTEIIRVDDITVPMIENTSIDETNTYITLITSEPVYNIYDQSGGVGGLSDSHFELSIEENVLNNVQNVDMENVTDEIGAPLQGGDITIMIEIVLSRVDASGSEVLTVSPSERPIHDRAGNEVPVFFNQKTVTLYDMLSPTVSFFPEASSLILPNTDFSLTFSETIKTYDLSGNIIDINTDIVNSLDLIKNQDGNAIDYETSLNIDSTIITLTPLEYLNESETYTLSFSNSIFCDQSGNSVGSEFIEYTVDDINPPSFTSAVLGSGNRYVRINMSEAVYTESSGVGALTSDDLNLAIDYGNPNGADQISIDYLSDINGGVLSGGEETVLVHLNITGSTNGTERVMINAVSGEIFDGSGNAMSANETTTEFDLWAAPVFSVNSILNDDNSYVTLFFDNGPVFTNAALNQPIQKQDFIVKLTRPGENISQVQIEEVLNTNGDPLVAFNDATCQVTSGSPTVTHEENANIVEGLSVSGAGIPPGATIESITNNTTFELSDSATSGDGSGISLAFTSVVNSVRIYVDLDFIPDGSDTIRFYPQSLTAIYNQDGVNMDTSQHSEPFTLSDQLPPFYNLSIQDGALNIENNDTIIVSFNEPVTMLGGEPLESVVAKENFIIVDETDGIELETFETTVNLTRDTVSVILDPENPYGSEHVISLTIKKDFQDFSGNTVLEDSTIQFTVRDNVSPAFVPGSAVIDVEEIENARGSSEESRSVCYVDLSINDDVFTDSIASLPVQHSDFSIGIIQNGGSVSSGNIENIELSETDVIGKDFLRLMIKFDTVPAGSESLFVHVAENSVYDNGFNPMSPDSTSDTLSLYDLRFPTIDSTSIRHNGHVDLYSDSTIIVYFSEPIKPESFEYSFTSENDNNFLHEKSLSADSLIIFLNTPLMSYDILYLNIEYLEDISGNIRQDLIGRKFFTRAAADFSVEPDSVINLEDLDEFIKGWYSDDLTKELGPTSGTAPNFKIHADSVFGIDDGMAFTQMWLWSLQTFGPTLVVQEQLVDLPSSILYSDNTISIMPPDNALSGQIMIDYDVTDYQIHPGDNNKLKSNGMLIGNTNEQMGISLIEYSLHKNKSDAVYFNVSKNHEASSEINLKYSFFDENFRLISKGDSILYMLAVPTEFSLMQNYPNPFNPSTKIRFDLPIDSFVSLIVYDINGRVINQLVDDYLKAGSHSITWHGQRSNGLDLSSGLYFYKIEAAGYSKTFKMVFVK